MQINFTPCVVVLTHSLSFEQMCLLEAEGWAWYRLPDPPAEYELGDVHPVHVIEAVANQSGDILFPDWLKNQHSALFFRIGGIQIWEQDGTEVATAFARHGFDVWPDSEGRVYVKSCVVAHSWFSKENRECGERWAYALRITSSSATVTSLLLETDHARDSAAWNEGYSFASDFKP